MDELRLVLWFFGGLLAGCAVFFAGFFAVVRWLDRRVR